jgi:hypothetical protein
MDASTEAGRNAEVLYVEAPNLLPGWVGSRFGYLAGMREALGALSLSPLPALCYQEVPVFQYQEIP